MPLLKGALRGTLLAALLASAPARAEEIAGPEAVIPETKSLTELVPAASEVPFSDALNHWPGCFGCQKDECCDDRPRLYTEIEAVFFTRYSFGNQILILDDLGDTQLTSRDMAFEMIGGPRVKVSYLSTPCTSFDFTYFGIHTWQTSQSIEGDNNLSIPGDLALASLDFNDADFMRATYSSDLDSYDAGVSALVHGPLAGMVGFRYIHLREKFELQSTDLDTGTSDYLVDSTNNLYGLQVGARLKFCRGPWLFQTSYKTAFCANVIDQDNYVGDFDNSYALRDAHGDTTKFALLNELNCAVALQLSKGMALRCGYNLLWMSNVGLATEQLDFNDTPTSGTSVHTGALIVHGLNVGMEMHF